LRRAVFIRDEQKFPCDRQVLHDDEQASTHQPAWTMVRGAVFVPCPSRSKFVSEESPLDWGKPNHFLKDKEYEKEATSVSRGLLLLARPPL
jgi:hypothetical protein